MTLDLSKLNNEGLRKLEKNIKKELDSRFDQLVQSSYSNLQEFNEDEEWHNLETSRLVARAAAKGYILYVK